METLLARVPRVRGRARRAVDSVAGRPANLATLVAHRPGQGADTIRERVDVLATALQLPAGTVQHRLQHLLARLERADADEAWLALSVLTGEFPEASEVARIVRTTTLNGAAQAWRALLLPASPSGRPRNPGRRVEVTDDVLVDVDHTYRTSLATGIQRVTREVCAAWVRAEHDCDFVGWTSDYRALRRLTTAERDVATGRAQPAQLAGGQHAGPPVADESRVVVPWRATYLLPEVATEGPRTLRMMAMALHSRSRTGAIGHDCIPISTAETTNTGVSEVFSWYLAVLRHFDVVAATSQGSHTEFAGWKRMLGAIGLPGPAVESIGLAITAPNPSEHDIARARAAFKVGDLPLLLCVGTHEPRKNHLAVLHAAELAWREGHRFSLSFVGGQGWHSEHFYNQVQQLADAGRPVETRSAIDDTLLWGAYRVAQAVICPSLNEGFGLPAAEALAAGTPVIVSNHGSLAEIGACGGAMMIDPRDDRALYRAIVQLIANRAVHRRLSEQARARSHITWPDYAERLWACLVQGDIR